MSSSVLTVRASVMFFVALVTAGAALMGGLAYLQGRTSEALTDRLLTDVRLTRSALLIDMVHEGLLATVRGALLAGHSAPAAEQAEVRAELAQFSQTLGDALALLRRHATEPEVRQAVQALAPVLSHYVRSADALVQAALQGQPVAAAQRQGFETEFKALEAQLGDLGDLIQTSAENTVAQRDALFARQRLMTLGAGLALVAVLAVLGARFAGRLLARLGAEPDALCRFAQGIATGALYSRFDSAATPPAQSVAGALLRMRDSLGTAVATIRDGAESVAAGSAQIASGNQDLAERTVRQGHRLQQAVAGMAEVTGAVGLTAGHTESAHALAAESAEVAQRGGQVVHQVVATMGMIETASRRIADITSVIEGIAAQTNILALNAAVEAARAGEQGQGFAVVAAEVRMLAQRSGAAAHEIRDLIDSSVRQVADGSRQASEAGATMGEIVAQVSRVNGLLADIDQATRQQTAGIGQVGASVTVLEQGTQQNAALVEQSAAAAVMLRDQAARLADAVGTFRLQPAG